MLEELHDELLEVFTRLSLSSLLVGLLRLVVLLPLVVMFRALAVPERG